MCGICGVIGIESRESSEPALRRMMAAMVHRGPDDEGSVIVPRAALGMRRLSVIDLPGGGQPQWNEDGTLAVAFNGEIYNFRALRAELQSAGHRFATSCDTEVIVHAYESWGERCVERLRGMFAFAVLKMPRGRGGPPERIFIARDPLGIKPLYYAQIDGALLFASEVRALLAGGMIAPRLSAAQISGYLLFGSVCEPSTLIEGVASLPPGHSLSVSVENPLAASKPGRYWIFNRDKVSEDARQDTHKGAIRPSEQVRSLLQQSVTSHLEADVPIGVFLSSGIDSTALATLASRARPGVQTFTVAFPELDFSEAAAARRTAERLGTQHTELTLSSQEMTEQLDEAIAAFDQPSMDGVNTYFVSWAARRAGLKVALSGLGSDELFGGYASFRNTARIERLSLLARFLPRWVRRAAIGCFGSASNRKPKTGKFAKVSAAWLDPDSFPDAYFFTRLLFPPQTVFPQARRRLENWESQPSLRWLADVAAEAASYDRFTAVSSLELRSYLVNTLLRDTDAMSMRHSLEIRVPFLDVRLVEYVLSLTESDKLDRSRPKSLLIRAMGDLLPQEIVARPKRTFTFPWERWLRGKLGERVAAGLQDWSLALQPHVSREFAAGVWHAFLHGCTTWSRPWSLYVLNEWVKRNIAMTGAVRTERERVATPAH